MIEITVTEIVLFCWAVLATGFAFKAHDELAATKRFAGMLIENPDMVFKIKTEIQKFEEENQ